MGVDYEQLLKDNEAAKQGDLQKVNESYSQTASDYQAEVDKQTQELENFQAEQKDLQQQQTDFAIDKINQQKEQAEKDYTKEQQAAYGDYKKQTDPYGVNAEQMAAMGLSRSGYSESSNVAMYTAYQNRVAAARASMEQAKLTFENMIQEAKLTNDINLAKIAQEVLEKKLALSMEGVIYLGNLEREKTATLRDIEQTYYGRAQDIRDAQQAEIAAARQGDYTITGDEGGAGDVGGDIITGNEGGDGATGNEDLTDVKEFFSNWNIKIDDIDKFRTTIGAMINTGIITIETVNGVEVYKVADEKKARAYMDKHFGAAAPKGDTGVTGGDNIDERIKAKLSTTFPAGVITDEDIWNGLVKEYGEETVRSWGYKPRTKGLSDYVGTFRTDRLE